MSLNFGGLGFGFEAEDTGAEKIANKVAVSLDKVWDNLSKIGPAAISATQKMTSGFGKLGSLGSKGLGGLSMALASAVESAQSPTLEGAYDSMFRSFNKSFSAMAAGMNMTSKESKKMERIIGSAAFALNEDMDTAGKTWAAFRKQNIDLTQVLGSKGTTGAIKDLIKVTAVYGIEGEQLANVASGLIKGFNFTEKRVGSLADKVFYLGRHFNMGNEAIQAWPAILESLNQELADFGRSAKPEDVEKLTTSIIALGGGLKDALGLPAQSALELSKTVFTTVMGERKNILNMFRGMGGEMGDFARQLAESGGSVQGMFEMINADPVKFMDSLRQMTAQAEKSGGTTGMAFQRLSGQMMQALGPDITFAAKGNWDKVRESMAQIPGVLDKSAGSFTEFAREAHRTAIGPQESWERSMEQIRKSMLNVSAGARKKWVNDMKSGFAKTTGVIQKMASEKGPIGELTQRLLLVKDVGLSGLFTGATSFGALSTLFGGVATSMFPAMTALGAMGLRFASLGKMALGGGLLYGLFYLLKHGPDETVEAIKNLGKTIWNFVSQVFPGINKVKEIFFDFKDSIKELGFAGAIKKAFGGKAWEGIKQTVRETFEKVFTWLKSINWIDVFGGMKSMFDMVWGSISSIDFKSVFNKISKAFAEVPWGSIISTVFDVAKSLVRGAVKIVKSFILGTDWKAVLSAVGKGLMAALTGAADLVIEFVKAIFEPSKIEDAASGPMQAGMLGALSGALVAIADAAVGLVKGLFSGLWKYVFDADSVSGGIGRITTVVASGFAILLIASKKFRTNLTLGFKTTFAKVRNEFAITQGKGLATFNTLRAGARGMARGIRGALKMFGGIGLVMGLIEGLGQIKTRMKNIGDIAVDQMIPDINKAALQGEQAFMGIMGTLDSIALGLPSMLGEALGVSSQDFSDFYQDMVGGFGKGIVSIVESFKGGMDYLTNSWDLFKTAFLGGWEIAKAGVFVIWEKIKLKWIEVVNKIKGAFDGLYYGIESVLLSISQTMESTIHTIMKKVAEVINNSPIATDAMSKWAKDFLESDKKLSKAGGLEKIHEKERANLEARRLADEQARARAEQEQQGKVDSAQSQFMKALANTALGVDAASKKRDKDVDKTRVEMEKQWKETDAQTAENKRLSAQENAKRKAAEDIDEAQSKEEEKKKRERKSKAGGVPSAIDQAGARSPNLPPGMAAEVQSLTGNVSNLTRNFSDFLKKPIDVKINVSSTSGLKKALKFEQNLQGREAT